MLRAGSIPKLYQPVDMPLSAASRSWLWLALSTYAIVTLFGVVLHIPWRDEAFAWLLARELDYPAMWNELRYNGATALWHTMVFPLAKLGLPVASQNYLHWLLAVFTAWLFLFRSPFHPLLRAAFLVSYYMIFEHVVIARCYLPSLTFTFLLCLAHKDRLTHPLRYAVCIFLLANCNIFSLAMAAVFGAFYALDVAGARSFTLGRSLALLLILTGGLLAFFTLLPASDAMDYYREAFPLRNFWRLPEGISAAFFIPHRYGYQIWVPGLLLGLAIVLPVLFLLWHNRLTLPLALIGITWCLMIYIVIFRYPWSTPRHFTYFLLPIVAALWLASSQLKHHLPYIERWLFCALVLSWLCSGTMGLRMLASEISAKPFSGGKDMAEYIAAHRLESEVFVSHKSEFAAVILPYLPRTHLWSAERQEFIRYIHFDHRMREKLSVVDIIQRTQAQFGHMEVLYLLERPIDKGQESKFTLLHRSPGSRETLYLYRLKKVSP